MSAARCSGSCVLSITSPTHAIPQRPDVPSVYDLAQTNEQRNVLNLFLGADEMGHPVALPPDVPPDRVEAVRLAFGNMIKDPAFLADAGADAIEALRSGTIDAYASTAVGNRILAERIGGSVESVDHEPKQRPPTGAFSFNKANIDLLDKVNRQLGLYLGSADHRARMAEFGLTNTEIDAGLVGG